MNYLIDTNICIDIMNKKPPEVIRRLKQLQIGQVAISSITVSELYYGVSKSRFREANSQRLLEFLIPFNVLSFDEKAARYYGEIRHQIEEKGQVIGPMDMLIAAHALSRGLVLVTNNEKEFKRVELLKVENWINTSYRKP